MSRWRTRIAWALFALCYLVAVVWVMTRSTPIVKQRPVTIRIAHWQIEAGPPDGIDAIIKRYEEINPRVHVIQELVPGVVFKQWLRANLTGGTGADLIEWGPWIDGVRDVPARYFEPITEALEKPNPYNKGTELENVKWSQTFTDALVSQQMYAPDPGQGYAVTLCEVSLRVFCNTDLLRKVTGSDKKPETFDDLRKIFAQLDEYNRRKASNVMAFAGAKDNTQWLLEFLVNGTVMGRNFAMDDDGHLGLYNRQVLAAYLAGKWNWQLPEVKAGLKLLQEIGRHMKPGFIQLTRDEATREFLHGDAIFIFAGTWDGTSLRRLAPFSVEALRFPQPTQDDPVAGKYMFGRVADGGGSTAMGTYLNKASPHKAEALDFMRFMTSMEGAQLFTDHSGWLPATKGVRIPPEIQSFKSPLDGYACANPYTLVGSEMPIVFARNIYLLLGQNGSVDQLTKKMDEISPRVVRTDLNTELRNTVLTLRGQDARLIAHAELAKQASGGGRHVREVELTSGGQTIAEGQALQMMRQLADAGPAPE